MKKRMMTFLLAVSACALLAGCGKDTAPKKDTTAKKETTTKKDDNNLNGIKSEGSTVFYRTDDKKPPHNAFTSEKGINAGIKKKNYETKLSADYTGHYTFAEDGKEVELTNGEDAVVVPVSYTHLTLPTT